MPRKPSLTPETQTIVGLFIREQRTQGVSWKAIAEQVRRRFNVELGRSRLNQLANATRPVALETRAQLIAFDREADPANLFINKKAG